MLLKYMDVLKRSIDQKRYTANVRINWILGTDNLDKSEDKKLVKIMETCTNNKEFFILAGSNPENLEGAFKCCNYMFLNTPDEKLYGKYKMSFTKKSDDNKTMDFKIVNYNQERSYKQLAFEFPAKEAPKLDFDSL